MAGIKIATALKKKLPEDEREGLEDYLWSESGGKCFLCERKMNRAADDIEADHDEPSAEGGLDSRDNLHLTHQTCNRAKKNSPTIQIQPYLKIRAFLSDNSNQANYADCTSHFGITPEPVFMEEKGGGKIRWEFSDGSDAICSVHEEINDEGEFKYCFVDVPRNSIFNDDECQPRNIKLGQIWAIYVDLKRNPLHEPPGCRVVSNGSSGYKLLMFDGQHKTVASWMRGYEKVTVKVYLSITQEQTIHLVNSVQAKIKKLPLSPFELAAKMAEEWREHWERYGEQEEAEKVSEQGFIKWLPKEERTRGKQALQEAVLQAYMDNDDLQLLAYVHRAGAPKDPTALITEASFKNKLLKRLVHINPLDTEGESLQKERDREIQNICKVLNLVSQEVFELESGGATPSDKKLSRRKRFTYQSSLMLVADILQQLVAYVMQVDAENAFTDKVITKTKLNEIRKGVKLLANHPVWTADLNKYKKTQDVQTLWRENKDSKKALEKLHFKLGYVLGGDKLPSDWYK